MMYIYTHTLIIHEYTIGDAGNEQCDGVSSAHSNGSVRGKLVRTTTWHCIHAAFSAPCCSYQGKSRINRRSSL